MRKRTSSWVCGDAELEGLLIRYKAMEGPSMALRRRGNGEEGENEEDEEDGVGEEVGMVNVRSGGLRSGIANGGRGGDSDDSDFDM